MIEDSNNTLNAIIKRLENGNKELENKIVFIIIKQNEYSDIKNKHDKYKKDTFDLIGKLSIEVTKVFCFNFIRKNLLM